MADIPEQYHLKTVSIGDPPDPSETHREDQKANLDV
jgi:hypothetical protein